VQIKSEVKRPNQLVEEEAEQERDKHASLLERKSFRIAITSIFSALCIVLGYMLVHLPNIELFTLSIFLSGFVLGKKNGIIVGFLSSFIFCFFNPFGPSPFPLLTFQLFHYSMTGCLGGLISDYINKKDYFKSDGDAFTFPIMVIFGLIGALITISFQIFSTLISVLTYLGIEEFIPYFLTGIVYTVIHIIGNTLGFVFILPGLIQLINKMLS